MQAHADAVLLAEERADEPRGRQAVARSVQDCSDAHQCDTHEIGQDASPPYDQRGLVIVASAWLAFYVIAAIHPLLSGN
jgi:hypothetical protein